jgi:tetratricopeptide (TPR) repeat protein
MTCSAIYSTDARKRRLQNHSNATLLLHTAPCNQTPNRHNLAAAAAAAVAAGKAYAAWRGHDQDALAAYDTLIGAFPTDFRGYLAKGVFLKERGRQGDAERMFLQAKFYAPEEMQAFVASRAGERALIEPLPDNGME